MYGSGAGEKNLRLGSAFNLAFQRGGGLPRLHLVYVKCPAAMKVMWPWHRAPGRINALQSA